MGQPAKGIGIEAPQMKRENVYTLKDTIKGSAFVQPKGQSIKNLLLN
jgi:hypothetical protein